MSYSNAYKTQQGSSYNGSDSDSKCVTPECINCIIEHVKEGNNYIWLNSLGHGRVVDVWFEEPVNSCKWRLYDEYWWAVHCKAIKHDKNLVDSHVKAFVNKRTRFAKLLFLFDDGTLMEPTKEFYELEDEWFNY